MHYTPDVSGFIMSNYEEIRRMISSVCYQYKIDSISDIENDFYVRLIENEILKQYNPSLTKISTYLYTIIDNMAKAHISSNESRINQKRISLDTLHLRSTRNYSSGKKLKWDEQQMPVDVKYEDLLCRNGISDSIDGLPLDLNLFEKYLEKQLKTVPKKNPPPPGAADIDLLEVFRLLRAGCAPCDLAELYGVTDMWLSMLKKELRRYLLRFGM